MALKHGRRPSLSARWAMAATPVLLALVVAAILAWQGSDSHRADSSSTTTTSRPHKSQGSHASTASTVPAPGSPDEANVIVAAGDIVCDPTSPYYNDGAGTDTYCQMDKTRALAESLNPVAVLALGDLQYECGTADEWRAFAKSWGTLGSLLRPVVGNHEYGHVCQRDDASPYFSYFGDAAGEPNKGWYSFDIGSWHLVALNSECSYGTVGGCGPGSEQYRWLRDDLAAHPVQCTIAFWHEPRFSSGEHGDNESMTEIWNLLVDSRTDIVLSGHNHDYERFDPLGKTEKVPGKQPINEEGEATEIQDPVTDPNGIREFIVGTGGKNLYPFKHRALTGEVVRNADTYGVLELTLRAGRYDWRFVPADGGGGFTDSGSAACV